MGGVKAMAASGGTVQGVAIMVGYAPAATWGGELAMCE